MDITKLDVVTLKSLAYDQLVIAETAQNNLKTINTEIAKKIQSSQPNQPVEAKVEEEVK